MIQVIAQIVTVGIAGFVGFGLGWVYRDNMIDWSPSEVIKQRAEVKGFYETWEDFQERKRGEKVDIFQVIDWEQEIKDTRVN